VVARTGNPLSRQSTSDLAKRAAQELNKPIGRTTVWRILDEDAIKPWQYEHWLFPRAPDFFAKASVVLDLYQGYWQGERLDPFDRVLSSDEKTSIQARIRAMRAQLVQDRRIVSVGQQAYPLEDHRGRQGAEEGGQQHEAQAQGQVAVGVL
jgi:hypothetical protein